MTPDEIKIATALPAIVLVPGIRAKALARSLASMAANHPHHELTPRQRAALLDIAIKYRRQIPVDLVDLARTLKGDE